MQPIHSLISNVVNYCNKNKTDLIAKLNGFLLIVMLSTLIVILNVRSNEKVYSDDSIVDEVEQIINKNTVEIESSIFKITFEKMYGCNNNHIIHSNDEDCKHYFNENSKTYLYFTSKYLTMDSYSKNTFLNKNNTKKINLSNFVYLDIGVLPYTLNYFYLSKNYRNSLYFNYIAMKEISGKSQEVISFIFARARAPGSITLAYNILLNILNKGSQYQGSLNYF